MIGHRNPDTDAICSAGFKREMLIETKGNLGEHHSGELHLEAAQAKAERIIAKELQRHGGRKEI